MNKSLQLGNKIELVTEVALSGHQDIYYSKVQEIIDDRTIVLLAPIVNGRVEPLEMGRKYGMTVYTDTGLYRCEVQVVNRKKSDRLYLISVERQTSLQKYQRRQFYRMDCMLSFQYKDEVDQDWHKGVILDISGGGMRFTSRYQLTTSKGLINHIVLSMLDDEEEELYLSGKIIASEPMDADPSVYENRVEFEGIDNYEREIIIKFIFEEERKRRSRRKG